jgi:hypothetical protein
MKKWWVALALALALAFSLGAMLGAPVEAAGLCFYTCDCNGTVLKCCQTSSGVACKPITGPAPIACPQVANC